MLFRNIHGINLTTMCLHVVTKTNMLPRNFFKVEDFMGVNNGNKLLCFESYLHKTIQRNANCCLYKMICITEILHY